MAPSPAAPPPAVRRAAGHRGAKRTAAPRPPARARCPRFPGGTAHRAARGSTPGATSAMSCESRAAFLDAPAAVQRHDTQHHVAPGDVGETRLAHAPGQLALGGEAPDALVQIAVG